VGDQEPNRVPAVEAEAYCGRRDESLQARRWRLMPFETTHWSLVMAARGDGSKARAALAKLCEMYWYPLYAYARGGAPIRTMPGISLKVS
jgi:hypothetical protein